MVNVNFKEISKNRILYLTIVLIFIVLHFIIKKFKIIGIEELLTAIFCTIYFTFTIYFFSTYKAQKQLCKNILAIFIVNIFLHIIVNLIISIYFKYFL